AVEGRGRRRRNGSEDGESGREGEGGKTIGGHGCPYPRVWAAMTPNCPGDDAVPLDAGAVGRPSQEGREDYCRNRPIRTGGYCERMAGFGRFLLPAMSASSASAARGA